MLLTWLLHPLAATHTYIRRAKIVPYLNQRAIQKEPAQELDPELSADIATVGTDSILPCVYIFAYSSQDERFAKYQVIVLQPASDLSTVE